MLPKKELGLLLLLVVISAITGVLNPQFLSRVNLLDMANLIGLFGIFSIGEGLTIITGGIDLSVGSMFSLLGVIFIDLVANQDVGWPLALLAVLAGGLLLGAMQGLLITRLRMQPFIVTLCGLLIYRGAARYYTDDATMGFGYGSDADTLSWLAAGPQLRRAAQFHLPDRRGADAGRRAAPFGVWPLSVRRRQERGSGTIFRDQHHAGDRRGLCAERLAGRYLDDLPGVLHQFGVALDVRQFLRVVCDRGRGAGRVQPAWRRGLDPGHRAGTALLQVLQNLVNILGIPSSLNFAVMGTVILLGVLADQQLQRRRGIAIAVAAQRAHPVGPAATSRPGT